MRIWLKKNILGHFLTIRQLRKWHKIPFSLQNNFVSTNLTAKEKRNPI